MGKVMRHQWGQLLSPPIYKLSRGSFICCAVLPVSSLQQWAPGKAAESLSDTSENKDNCGSKYMRSLWPFTETLSVLPDSYHCTLIHCVLQLSPPLLLIFCPQASLHTCFITLLLAESQLNKQNHSKMSQKLLWKCPALLCAQRLPWCFYEVWNEDSWPFSH